MTRLSLSFAFVAAIFFTTSCDSFSTQTYTPQQIKKAAEWAKTDQYPNFDSCDASDPEDNFVCFKNTIAGAVENALYENSFIANQEIDEELVLEILIDENGAISLADVENGSYVYAAVPELSAVIENAIAGLPSATPAQKSNVEVTVKSTIKLPIRVSASVQ